MYPRPVGWMVWDTPGSPCNPVGQDGKDNFTWSWNSHCPNRHAVSGNAEHVWSWSRNEHAGAMQAKYTRCWHHNIGVLVGNKSVNDMMHQSVYCIDMYMYVSYSGLFPNCSPLALCIPPTFLTWKSTMRVAMIF